MPELMEFKLGPHESLTQQSDDWDFNNDGDAKELEKQMINFMIENRGIGLAANQIGLTKKVFVMGSSNIAGFPEPFAVFNPKIISASNEIELDKEGCLSYPDLWLNVKRPKSITVEYYNSDGNLITAELTGYIARCFQHEYDHLNGVCFVDRVSSLKLQLAMKKIKKRATR
jgi:peptide deformylase